MDQQLHLHQELMLLILDDSKGTFDGNMYHYGLAGAMLSELLIQGRFKGFQRRRKKGQRSTA